MVASGEGNHVYANRRAVEITGYSVVELLKTSIKDLAHPAELKKLMERYRKRLEGETVIRQYETIIVRKDGQSVPVEIAPTKTVWKGKPADMVFVRDITERKKSEEALRESEERFRLASQIANDQVYERDARTGVATFYGDIDAQMGYGPGEFPRTVDGWIDYVHPEDAGKVMEQVGKQAGKGDTFIVEYRVRKKDGTYMYWIDRFTNVWDAKREKVVKIIGVATDVTESKVAEAVLRESEERFRRVLDNAIDMIYWVNLKTGKYDYVAPSSEKVIGYTPDELIALGIAGGRSLAHPDDSERLDENVIDLLMNAGNGNAASAIEYRFAHKKLGYRWMFDNRSIVYDGDEPVAIVGSLRDITERKQAEEELWRTRERLQLMFDSVKDGVCVTDLGGTITEVNPKGLEMYRASTKEELIGKSAFELIVPHEREKAIAEMQKSPGTRDYRAYRTQCGEGRWFKVFG